MPEPMPMKEFCEKRARQGDAGFAIAYALIDLADSQEATAAAIQRLGNGNASTHFGAIENLAMQMEKAAQSLTYAIDGAGSAIASALQEADPGQRPD